MSLLLIFLLAIVILSSCNGNPYVDNTLVNVYSPVESCLEVTDLEPFIEDISIIPLYSEFDLYVIPSKILLTEYSMIVLSGGQVYVFSKEGRFLFRINDLFDDSGDYQYINDICLNSEGDEILCLSHHNSVYIYSSLTGDYKGCVDSGIHGNTAETVLPIEKGFALVFFNPTDETDFENDFYCLKCFNRHGRLIGESILRDDFNIPFAQYRPSVQGPDNEYFLLFSPSSADCYSFHDGAINKFCSITFGDKGLPYRFSIHGTERPWNYLSEIFQSTYYKCPFSFTRTSDVFFCCSYGENGSVWNFLWDSCGGIKWRSYGKYQLVMNALASDSDYIYYILTEPDIMNEKDTHDPLKKAIVKWTGYVYNNESSPAIVKLKFKVRNEAE